MQVKNELPPLARIAFAEPSSARCGLLQCGGQFEERGKEEIRLRLPG
jgi:hypothetical protein